MKKQKVIEIYTETGRFYHVPLHVVAENRAKYYEKIDRDVPFQASVDFVMEDDNAGIDWYLSNMNPVDVKHHAVLIKDVNSPKFEDEMVEDIRIIEVAG